MCLTEAEAALGKPGQASAAFGYRFIDISLGRKGDPAAIGMHVAEKFGVLATGASKRQVEATPGHMRRIKAKEDVAGVTGADFAADPDGQGRVEVTLAHPTRRRGGIDAADRAKHGIRLGLPGRGKQFHQPLLAGVLIVVDEGQEVAGRIVQACVAGNRDVRCRAVHIGNLMRNGRAKRIDPFPRTRNLVVVGHDDPQLCPFRHGEDRKRKQRFVKRSAAVGANANIDQHGFRIVHEETFLPRKLRSSIQKPADQAKCITIAETAASGPYGFLWPMAIQKP